MSIENCLLHNQSILMEGALGERLKREYHLAFDDSVAMANLIYTKEGRNALHDLWMEYITIARTYQLPFLATTPTRRANQERVKKSNASPSIMKDNVEFLRGLQKESKTQMYIGGLMGCKGDAYTGEGALSEREAHTFHSWQADQFREAKVDFLYAGIMPSISEATGMAQAMADTKIPYIISFTIQRDGKLIDGTTIHDAIFTIDDSVKQQPICYMANCVHPRIVYEALSQPFNRNELVTNRFLGIQANTSPLPYAQLDGSKDLKCSNPVLLAEEMMKLRDEKYLKIFGGCCGTDYRHMEEIAKRL